MVFKGLKTRGKEEDSYNEDINLTKEWNRIVVYYSNSDVPAAAMDRDSWPPSTNTKYYETEVYLNILKNH